MENLQVTVSEEVRAIMALYDAFGRGDIPYILDHVSENFTWTDPNDPSIVPHGGTYKGKDFLNFFQNLGGGSDTTLFNVDEYTQGDNVVIATGQHGIVVKKTGKAVTFDWAIVWHFHNGTPISGRSYYDTARAEEAFQ